MEGEPAGNGPESPLDGAENQKDIYDEWQNQDQWEEEDWGTYEDELQEAQ